MAYETSETGHIFKVLESLKAIDNRLKRVTLQFSHLGCKSGCRVQKREIKKKWAKRLLLLQAFDLFIQTFNIKREKGFVILILLIISKANERDVKAIFPFLVSILATLSPSSP